MFISEEIRNQVHLNTRGIQAIDFESKRRSRINNMVEKYCEAGYKVVPSNIISAIKMVRKKYARRLHARNEELFINQLGEVFIPKSANN
tara:strand:+ start:92 stop:358 length:267 start_codon:yes stop_codon:yes gene_type:complete